ncbi:MAG: prephenate dehydratase [Anaerovorax sp.]|nr:prephenate dehydratase [Anaerovorax sp.]
MELENKVVGFQGTIGSFSEEALIRYFGEYQKRQEYPEFEDVFIALREGKIAYGVLPIENSSTGAISATYDLLKQYDCYIVGETYCSIKHHLIGFSGTKLSEIKEVYSHIQGLEQCSNFLNRFSNWKLIPFHNTAVSAKLVKESQSKVKAAIASERAAKVYNLTILEKNIHNQENNTTRFVIVGRHLERNTFSNKFSAVLSLENRAGFLYELLGAFAKNNVNLVKIESRPLKEHAFQYCLYLDFEGDLQGENVKRALETIEKGGYDFRLLGSYVKEVQL